MNKPMKNIQNRMRLGWLLLVGGLILVVVGIALQRILVDPGFNLRIISALGILLVGLGSANLVRYAAARSNPQVAKRLTIEEHDERLQLLRARAGNRAFWVSTGLAYILLMWLSFASNGSLPDLSSDGLWWCLAGVVIIPLGVYAASLVYDEHHM